MPALTLAALLALTAPAEAARCTVSAAKFVGTGVRYQAGSAADLSKLQGLGGEGTVKLTLSGCKLPEDTSRLSSVTLTVPVSQGVAELTLSGQVTRSSGGTVSYGFHQLQIDHVGEDGSTSAHLTWSDGR